MAHKYQFLINSSPDEVLSVIARYKNKTYSSGITGTVYDNDRFKIFYKSEGRNSWNPAFVGNVLPKSYGSILSGSFKTPVATILFTWIWRTMVALPILKSLLINDLNISDIPSVLFIMLIFSFVVECIGVTAAKANKKKVLIFLETLSLASNSHNNVNE